VNLVGRSGNAFSTLTGEDGVFEINVSPDVYRIEFSRDHFETYQLDGYRIASGKRMQIDVALNVAVIIDTVDIVGAKREEKTSLVGAIYDPNGAAISGVNITFRSENNTLLKTTTNNDGHYEIGLTPGRYSVEFSSPGFKRTVIDDFRIVRLGAGKLRHDVIM